MANNLVVYRRPDCFLPEDLSMVAWNPDNGKILSCPWVPLWDIEHVVRDGHRGLVNHMADGGHFNRLNMAEVMGLQFDTELAAFLGINLDPVAEKLLHNRELEPGNLPPEIESGDDAISDEQYFQALDSELVRLAVEGVLSESMMNEPRIRGLLAEGVVPLDFEDSFNEKFNVHSGFHLN